MKTITVNYRLIEIFACQRQLRLLAYFYYFKRVNQNGVFYNYSIKSMAARSSLSRKPVRKYVPKLIQAGLARHIGGHLSFISWKDAGDLYDCWHGLNVKIPQGTPKQILKQLQFLTIQYKAKQQDYIVSLKVNSLQKQKALPAVKRLRRLRIKAPESEKQVMPGYVKSYIGIGKMFGCGKSNAFKMVSALIRDGKMRKKWKPLIVVGDVKAELEGTFIHTGIVCKREINQYFVNGVPKVN